MRSTIRIYLAVRYDAPWAHFPIAETDTAWPLLRSNKPVSRISAVLRLVQRGSAKLRAMKLMLTEVLALVFVSACSSSSPGVEGQVCYANGTCNAGLTCLSNLCVNAAGDAGLHDAAVETSTDAAAPDAADAAEAAAPVDIQSVAGLTIWLDAAKGVTLEQTDRVTTWTDQSKNALVAKSLAAPPLFVAAGIHDLPTVDFDSLSEVLMISELGAPSLGDFVFEVVASVPTSATTRGFFGSGDQYGSVKTFGMGLTSAGVASFSAYTESSTLAGSFLGTRAGLSNGTPHLFGLHRTGSTIEIRIDGVIDATDTKVGYAAGYPGLTLKFGSFTEVVVINGTTPTATIAGVEATLMSKYGI
ncbi:hypothetical protein BH09MYX1_BH09MYX1_66220 [soil metagenome]